MVDSVGSRSLHCIVVTPEKTLLDTQAEFVAIPLYDGELGIGPGHAPMIGRLGYGELRVRRAGSVERYYVDGGFVQVADNVASILTNRAIPAAQLDAASAQLALREAIANQVAGEDAMLARERIIKQSRAQLRVARKKG
jgi:F-type H+-transporting ATPase subunit epsilon